MMGMKLIIMAVGNEKNHAVDHNKNSNMIGRGMFDLDFNQNHGQQQQEQHEQHQQPHFQSTIINTNSPLSNRLSIFHQPLDNITLPNQQHSPPVS